jgi:hypothetical protein
MGVTVEIEIDDYDIDKILDQLNPEELVEYLINNNVDIESYYSKDRDLVEEYYHGDFDPKRFLKNIRKEDAVKICSDFLKEEAFKV